MNKPSEHYRLGSRTAARIAAVQALFQHQQSSEDLNQIEQQFLFFRLRPAEIDATSGDNTLMEKADVKFFSQLIQSAQVYFPTSLEQITQTLPVEWPLNRIDPVLKSLLCMAIIELYAFKETPSRVVINEYINVAHSFFSGDEPKMANGILNTIARTLRPDDFSQ
ncbi:transcription antitermination factor NusB [Entomobacter blattae]|uniref:Transcription antitermination protein NusB n=1 Tax=Entomobacter blattae TaxID=2762277 RepID=A0A7H1NSZ0_9PROT|nr:transcription antitermination factor NusB [Entomobacter blattae]QNT78900.1 Transcription antitermination protein NusB [Entomobacter blattae]